MFLTRDELRDLTGFRRPEAQLRWLLDNGFTAIRRADGRVVVAREHVLEVLGVKPAHVEADPEPDWSALDS